MIALAFEADGLDGILLGYCGSTGYLYKEQRMEVIEWLQQKDHWLLKELSTHLCQKYDERIQISSKLLRFIHTSGTKLEKNTKTQSKTQSRGGGCPKKVTLRMLAAAPGRCSCPAWFEY
jgi:transposase